MTDTDRREEIEEGLAPLPSSGTADETADEG